MPNFKLEDYTRLANDVRRVNGELREGGKFSPQVWLMLHEAANALQAVNATRTAYVWAVMSASHDSVVPQLKRVFISGDAEQPKPTFTYFRGHKWVHEAYTLLFSCSSATLGEATTKAKLQLKTAEYEWALPYFREPGAYTLTMR